ncbi:transporter [Ferruginibacter sp.]
MLKNILLPAFIFCTLSAVAQDEKIDTDRPDQTESASTVPKKWVQFESGFLKEVFKNGRFRDITYEHPSLLTKYGLSKWLELRLITTYITSKGKEDSRVLDKETGLSGVEFGGKANFFAEKGWRPKTSLIAHYDFAGLRTLFKDTVDGFNFRFTMQHTLTEKLGLGYNIGMEWERFDKAPGYVYTFAPGYNISDKWYAYIEVFGTIWKDEKPENSLDGGIAYYINDNLKVDASGGFGLSSQAPDYYAAVGLSFRFKAAK